MDNSVFSDFLFARDGQTLAVSGELFRVSEEEALSTAQKYGTGVVGLIPFDPQQAPYLVVPEHWEKVATDAAPAAETMPDPTQILGLDSPGYRQAVSAALQHLNQGALDKVVLARLLEIEYEHSVLNPRQVFQNLLAQQPRAFVFSAKLPDSESYLMGASPELVFRSEGGKFVTHPLAGSAPRVHPTGSTDDAQAGEALLRSPKDRAEHATVVNDIQTRLSPLVQHLEVPSVPSLLATPQLWHLGTRICGELSPGYSSLDGARAIHPTPAICGFPTLAALDMIRELEDFERGYFGGLVGWMDADGNGEWALVLRCARVSPRSATLFAGAGIVKGSTAVNEHTETAHKLGSFGKALGISTLSD